MLTKLQAIMIAYLKGATAPIAPVRGSTASALHNFLNNYLQVLPQHEISVQLIYRTYIVQGMHNSYATKIPNMNALQNMG